MPAYTCFTLSLNRVPLQVLLNLCLLFNTPEALAFRSVCNGSLLKAIPMMQSGTCTGVRAPRISMNSRLRKLATDFGRTNDGGTANARDTPLRVHHSRNAGGVVGLLASIDPARIGARIHFPACLIVSMAGTFGLFIFGNQFKSSAKW